MSQEDSTVVDELTRSEAPSNISDKDIQEVIGDCTTAREQLLEIVAALLRKPLSDDELEHAFKSHERKKAQNKKYAGKKKPSKAERSSVAASAAKLRLDQRQRLKRQRFRLAMIELRRTGRIAPPEKHKRVNVKESKVKVESETKSEEEIKICGKRGEEEVYSGESAEKTMRFEETA